MIYISAQPDELFYAWQIEVMLDNFMSVDILAANNIHILIGINKTIGEYWYKLIEKYKEVEFFFYIDTRKNKEYSPSIRPHILSKHWERFPYLNSVPIFYHDCDILFTRKPDFEFLLKDRIWYVSDTRSYIGCEYIKSKGIEIFEQMCKCCDISQTKVERENDNTGGAQYLMKYVPRSFWYKVEYYSNILYEYLNHIDSDIQKWTADMWALLWTSWNCDFTVRINPYLNFSMATDTWPKWNQNLIYHNAGVTNIIKDRLFFKGDFRAKLPYRKDNIYDDEFCSYMYFNSVINTGIHTCLKDDRPSEQELLSICKSIFINV